MMYNRLAVGALVLVIAAVLMMSCGHLTDRKNASTQDSTESQVRNLIEMGSQKVDTIDLGRVQEGEVVESSFAVRNGSDKPELIFDIVTGCGCTTVDYESKPFSEGEVRNITFRFDSKGRFGAQLKEIFIQTSLGMNKIVVRAEVQN